MDHDEHTHRARSLWIIGVIVVLFYALIPVIWIIVAVAEDAGDDRRRQLPPDALDAATTTTPSSTTGFFTAALRNSIGIALITTRDRARVRVDGGLRDHAPGLPGQDR